MERLDLRLVEYFVAVAEELHFGRAAERLHIAQPSLSQQIRKLEAQLGVTLLERTSRRVALTPAGKAMLREGRRTLAQSERAMRAARAAGRERVVVGFYGSAADGLLPQVLRAISADNPAIDVTVRELMFGSLDDVFHGKVDLAFARLIPGQGELEVEVVGHQARVVAVPAAHSLASRRSVTFGDLRDERFITNPAVEDDATPTRWLAEQRRHGLPGRVATRAGSIPEILTLVAAGRGVCLVPAPVAELHPRADIAYVTVSDAEPAVVSLIWSREQLRPCVQAVIAAARRAAEAL